jgi:hypothetical protein
MVFAKVLEQREAVDVRHSQVRHHDIERLLSKRRHRDVAPLREGHIPLSSVLTQQEAQAVEHVAVVIDEQDSL